VTAPNSAHDELLTREQVAQLLGCKPRSIQNLVGKKSGRMSGLPFIQTPMGRRFEKTAVHKWIARRATLAATRHALALAAQRQPGLAPCWPAVYGLVDPVLKEMFYVGFTLRRPDQRLQEHIHAAKTAEYRAATGSGSRKVMARIRSILTAGHRPTYVVLEYTNDPASEQIWIDYMRAQGMPLLNKAHAPGGRTIVPKLPRKPRYIDETGKTYGRLRVIQYAGFWRRPNGNPVTMWECVCSCGRLCTVSGQHLRDSRSTHCSACPRKRPARHVTQSASTKPPAPQNVPTGQRASRVLAPEMASAIRSVLAQKRCARPTG
jgi:hypothetical protein